MAETEDKLLVSEVARRAGVNVQTVLFYERRGVVPKAMRRPSGYREFERQTVDVIRFVQRAQELGFTLKEITELLALRSTKSTKCEFVRQKAVQKLNLIETKLEQLSGMHKALTKLVRSCSGRGPIRDCPIIEAMNHRSEAAGSRSSPKRRKR